MIKTTLLIVEEDANILNANSSALELEGYRVETAKSLREARAAVEAFAPDLILMDILLPDGNGLQYCQELRGESSVRILFLSARCAKADVLAGFRAGCDDYLVKPYDMDELILRVGALLRRGRTAGPDESQLVLGRLTLNRTAMRATQDGCDLMLKPKEFAILCLLAENRGRTLSAKEMYTNIWGRMQLATPEPSRSTFPVSAENWAKVTGCPFYRIAAVVTGLRSERMLQFSANAAGGVITPLPHACHSRGFARVRRMPHVVHRNGKVVKS